jgi:cbb3-type cytochrome oxidase subunit 3
MMEIEVFRGLVTGALLGLFVWLVIWSWSQKRQSDFESAARLPLEDEEPRP